MALGDRLGIAGLILALVALGITIMWPTKRPIAYVCFAIAAILCGWWAIAELRAKHEEVASPSLEKPKVPVPTSDAPRASLLPHPLNAPGKKGVVRVLDFNPIGEKIGVSNETNENVFVMSAMISTPFQPGDTPETTSFAIDEGLPAHTTMALKIGGYEPFTTAGPVGADFRTQVTLARAQYPTPNCAFLVYFSPENPSIKMIVDHYSNSPFPLPVGNGVGTLTYRRGNSTAVNVADFPVKVIVSIKNSCTPKPH
jgi:hypothetical protein